MSINSRGSKSRFATPIRTAQYVKATSCDVASDHCQALVVGISSRLQYALKSKVLTAAGEIILSEIYRYRTGTGSYNEDMDGRIGLVLQEVVGPAGWCLSRYPNAFEPWLLESNGIL